MVEGFYAAVARDILGRAPMECLQQKAIQD